MASSGGTAKGQAMTTITIEITDEEMAALKERAAAIGVSPEELAATGIAKVLEERSDDFDQIIDYVVRKNAELYRRLA
jgi:antitoxin FitA